MLVPVAVQLPILIQWIACGWLALGSGTAVLDGDLVSDYVRALYWAMTTLTTVGYGDIAAKNVPQMLYVCGVQFLGVGVFGYIVSNVASLLARSDAAREHHMENLDKVETFMKLHSLPVNVRNQIRGYYHHVWKHQRGYGGESLLTDLPSKLQSDIFLHLNRNIAKKVPFLREASEDLLRELLGSLKPRTLVPGEFVFHQGDIGDSMYFIQSGHVDIVIDKQKIVAQLRDGDCFGEMALISDQLRGASARSGSYCEVYCLSKKDFNRVLALHPQFAEHLHRVVAQRTAA